MSSVRSIAWVLGALVVACSSSSNTPLADGGAAGSGGSGGGGAGGDSGATSTDQVCTELANTVCAKIASCGSAALDLFRYADMNQCTTLQKALCTATFMLPDDRRTPAEEQPCIAAYASVSCADIIDNHPPDACRAFTGPRANGAACASGGQCQSGRCVYTSGASCGTCGTLVAAGGSCANGEACDTGLYCNSATTKCTAFAALGEACDSNTRCVFGTSCVGEKAGDAGTAGKCQPVATAAMAACDTSVDTGSRCDPYAGLVCETKTCVAELTATAGQPCGALAPKTYTRCTGGARCSIDPGAATGMCIGTVPAGGACDTSKKLDCQPTLTCLGTANGTFSSGMCGLRAGQTCK